MLSWKVDIVATKLEKGDRRKLYKLVQSLTGLKQRYARALIAQSTPFVLIKGVDSDKAAAQRDALTKCGLLCDLKEMKDNCKEPSVLLPVPLVKKLGENRLSKFLNLLVFLLLLYFFYQLCQS